ncbi:unnamed protein product [Schistosoma margrebowiei]|uniref:Uncharacterized protein n=1 Tax=Schistosoma margrebowiei TaxID=48269 RepID=A0A183LMT4_9TREM|nr:unnamed protein product [Schistosoma margrebowiei]
MKTSTSEEKHGMQYTSRMKLDDLDFTDDLPILKQTQQQICKSSISTIEEHLELKATVCQPTPKTELSIQMSIQFNCMGGNFENYERNHSEYTCVY